MKTFLLDLLLFGMFGEFEFFYVAICSTGPVFLVFFLCQLWVLFCSSTFWRCLHCRDYFLLDLHCFGAFELFDTAVCSTDVTADLLDWHFFGDILDLSPLVANPDDEGSCIATDSYSDKFLVAWWSSTSLGNMGKEIARTSRQRNDNGAFQKQLSDIIKLDIVCILAQLITQLSSIAHNLRHPHRFTHFYHTNVLIFKNTELKLKIPLVTKYPVWL